MMTTAKVLAPTDGRLEEIGGMGVRFMAGAGETGGHFSLVEHPLEPRALASPRHRHSREDEYSYVLSGKVGVELGGEVLVAGPGDFVFKPRDQWHAFWNAGDEPASLLEIIAPGGFEQYFADLAETFGSGGEMDPARIVAIAAGYGLELDPASIPELCERHGLVFG